MLIAFVAWAQKQGSAAQRHLRSHSCSFSSSARNCPCSEMCVCLCWLLHLLCWQLCCAWVEHHAESTAAVAVRSALLECAAASGKESCVQSSQCIFCHHSCSCSARFTHHHTMCVFIGCFMFVPAALWHTVLKSNVLSTAAAVARPASPECAAPSGTGVGISVGEIPPLSNQAMCVAMHTACCCVGLLGCGTEEHTICAQKGN